MTFGGRFAAALAVTLLAPFSLSAQSVENGAPVPDVDAPLEAAQAALADAASASAQPAIAPDSGCELHVWPTHNYLGFNSGLLSGFGLVGALADQAAHEGHVKTVKDLMRDYLGPEVQLAELEKAGYRTILNKESYQLIIEEPTPFNEDLKNNPELKAKVKMMNAKLKSGERLTESKNPCYAEFFITNVMYHKATLYGSNLFAGIIFRDFSGAGAPLTSIGAVKNPLEEFPPKTPEMVEKAQAELRDAFGKDFVEWTQKKLKK